MVRQGYMFRKKALVRNGTNRTCSMDLANVLKGKRPIVLVGCESPNQRRTGTQYEVARGTAPRQFRENPWISLG
jgi:hypothetical protein